MEQTTVRKNMGQNGFTLCSFFLQVPLRKAPKRSKSHTLTPCDVLNVNSDDGSRESHNESPMSSHAGRMTILIFIRHNRIKVVLACILCALPLLWDQWALGSRYDIRNTSVISKEATTSAATDTITSRTNIATADASTPQLENIATGTLITATRSYSQPPTLSPSTTTVSMNQSTEAPNLKDTSFLENLHKSHILVVQWSHWKDLEQIVASIWGGNLFCSTIDSIVKQYYDNRTINITVQTNVTDTITNVTRTVPIVKQTTPLDLPIPTIHFDIELSCYDLYTKSAEGTGNYIEAIYMMRLALQYITYAKVQLNITCSDNTLEFQTDYVLPWFTGVWRSPNYVVNAKSENDEPIELQSDSSPQKLQEVARLPESLTKEEYCGSFKTAPTGILYTQMKYDVQRMAIALTCNSRKIQTRQQEQAKSFPHRVKVLTFLKRNIYSSNKKKLDQNMTATNPTKIASSSLRKQTYLYADNQQERLTPMSHVKPLIEPRNGDPPIEFDDAIIHFRCGDLLSTTLTSYGFLTFNGYSRHISKMTTRSIGILTQPFASSAESSAIKQMQVRTLDSSNVQQVERCRTLVHAFKDYLEEQFPDAKISIRNNKSETIALAYARMVMAKQVIGCMSTFSIFPILGTFGTGYYLRPRLYDPSMWLTHELYPVTNFTDPQNSFVLFDDSNVLVGPQTKDLWDKHGDDVVLKWFRTGKYFK